MSIHRKKDAKPKIYRHRPLTEAEKNDPDFEYVEVAECDNPCDRNREMEATPERDGLKDGQGNVEILVTSGDEAIGDLGVRVQFEGPHGKRDECIDAHNATLTKTSEWVKDALSELFPKVDWEVDAESDPCDKTTRRPEILEALDLAEGLDVVRDREEQRRRNERRDRERG